MARALRNAGAQVHLILGGDLKAPWGMETIRVRSAQEMLEACEKRWPSMDGLIAAAAVADQRPETCAAEKVKKSEGPETLVLVRTPDVLATLSARKRPGQWVVGFAAESEEHVANAQSKLRKKQLDVVLVNDIAAGKGFGVQANTLTPVSALGASEPIGPLDKDRLAQGVVTWLDAFLAAATPQDSENTRSMDSARE